MLYDTLRKGYSMHVLCHSEGSWNQSLQTPMSDCILHFLRRDIYHFAYLGIYEFDIWNCFKARLVLIFASLCLYVYLDLLI